MVSKCVLFFQTGNWLYCWLEGVVCVLCSACDVGIRQALKARDNLLTVSHIYQLRWLKSKRVCCVLSCGSVD